MNDRELVVIRPAEIGDLGRVYAFICDLEETVCNARDFEAVFRANLLNKNNIYLIAEVDDSVSGFASCHLQFLLHHVGWIAEIQELFVKEEMRKRGIGKKLIHHLKNTLTKKGVLQLEVTSNISRVDSHLFYKQAGFSHSHLKFTMLL